MNLAPVFRAAGYEYQPAVFTRASWDELFPDNRVVSSLGNVALAPEALDLPEGHLLGLVKATLAEPMAVFLRADVQTFWRPVLVKGEVAAFAVVEVMGESAKLDLRTKFPALPDREAILIADPDGPDEVLFKGLSLTLTANDIMGLTACLSVITDFGLASALGHWQHDFLKGDHGPIPADARWITVHPNGDGSKGVPILIQPTPHGHFRVIGGAGGKLNMLKLRGVKSEAEYRQDHAERADFKKRAHKEQIRRDKELGIHTAKQQARANLEQQAKDAEREHFKAVAAEMGWDEKDLTPNVEGLSEQAAAKVTREHASALKAKVQQAVQLQREVLKADKEKRDAAGLGSIPLDPASGELSVQDLDPIRVTDPAGLTHNFAGRAADAGLDDAKLEQQVSAIKDLTPEEQAAAQEKKLDRESVAAAIKEEIKDLAKPNLAVKVADTEKAVAILKSARKLKDLQAQVRKARKEVDTSLTEPKAFVAVAAEVADKDIHQSIAEELSTLKAVSFLAGVKKVGDEDAVAPHVLMGAHNALNGVSQAVGGASLMDRSVVDVLGVAGAAQVLARRIQTDYADKLEEITAGLEDYHVASAPERQQAALDEAADIQERIAALAPEGDLAAASAINRQKRDALREARTTMGQALGEMEATASLIMALRGGHKDEIQVSLGDTPLSSALQQLWAVGLAREDYQIDRVAGNVFLTLKGSGMDKLAAPVDRDNLERVRRNLAIQRGAEDEDNWLPDGFAKRPDLALHLNPGVTASIAVPLDTEAPDLQAALRDFVGSRTADGHRAADILADVQSATYFDRIGAARADEYRAALAAVIPTKKANGKLARVEDLQPQFEAMADAYVAKLGGERSTLNRQTIPVDTVSQDALHRALSEEPAGVAAYKPIGDLTHEDVKALREWFATNIAKESPEGAQLRQAADKLASQEPDRYEVDMFGDSVESPAWSAWKADYDQAQAEHAASGLTWAGYVKAMRTPQKARAAVQDMIRSQVSASFAKHYNTLRPESAIKVGKTVVRHNLNHLDAVDPQAREQRLAQQRQLIDGLRERTTGGQYASGSVNVDQALENQAAFNQAQMGFFAAEDLPTTDTAMKMDERHTIGQAAENTLAEMMGVVGKQFKPGQPVKLFQPTMSGQGIDRQRAIKLIAENKRVVLGAGVGSGKAQPLSARVLTPSGWCCMGDLTVGDRVIAGDGSVARVTGVFPQGKKDIFRVTMVDGGSTECCADHLWRTTTEVERKRVAFQRNGGGLSRLAKDLPLWSIRSTDEIAKTLAVRHGIRNHQIPTAGDPQFDHQDVPLDPYLLGVLLGDGCMTSKKLMLSTPDPEILSAVTALLPSGIAPHHDSRVDYRLSSGRRFGDANPLYVALESLGLIGRRSQDKFVPDVYLFNSRQCRLDVLQGLMDTDGTVSRRGHHVTFTTVSVALADAVKFITRSLGGKASQTSKWPTYTYKGEKLAGQKAFTVTLTLPPDVAPFRLARKAERVVPKSKYAPSGRVVMSVEPVGRKEARCIAIDHPSHLYVTDDFIVTHNTAMMLGSFAQLHSQGKIRKGVIVCPSIVQGQMGSEALRFLNPGQFTWHCEPGASYEERLAAYQDPDTHFTVVTHQSFRNDLLKMASAMTGEKAETIATHMDAMTQGERAAFIKGVTAHHGIQFDYTAVDEGHNLLDREGKANSRMSNVIGGVIDNSEYAVSATGDPVKNDPSEIHSALAHMDPVRYSDRDAFMRRYGGDTQAAKEGLQREMARHLFAFSLNPDVAVTKREEKIAPSSAQQAALEAIDRQSAALRIAKLSGKVDVESAQALAPNLFEGADPSEHEAIAKVVAADAGLHRRSATRRVLDNHPQAAKLDRVAAIAGERKGQQGVVFVRSLAAVDAIKKRLEAEGHSVVGLTGADTAEQKAEKIRAFNPESGKAKADIIVSSDAGATGANLQSGRWLVQYDTSDTAYIHAQRQGRINRIGQKNAVELIDLVSDHPDEKRARQRLAEKYELRDLMTSRLDGLDDTGLGHYLAQRGFGAQKTQGDLF